MRNDIKELEEAYRWAGFLTVENIEAVAERLRRDFLGRPYTWVTVDEFMLWRPEVSTGRLLEKVIVHKDAHDGRAFGDLTLISNESLSFISTMVADREEALKVHYEGTQGKELTWAAKQLSHITIKDRQVRIEHYNDEGQRMFWTLALEGDRE